MIKILNYNDAVTHIHSLGNFSRPAGLDRITELLRRLGNPQNKLRAIHIAGTNGKGSVSAMLAKILQTAGYKTGLYISPYIIDFRERAQINGEFIPQDAVTKLSQRIIDAGTDVSEFEFITAMAFLWFAESGCDVVIAETGLGGRLDATNTLSNVAAAVITKIGLDHMGLLGNSVEEIAAEKCGIIKGFPVIVSANQSHAVYEVVKKFSNNPVIPDVSHLKIIESDTFGNTFIYKERKYTLSLTGSYQIENALTVIETVLNCGFNIPYSAVEYALKNTFFPARCEVICRDPLVLLDGAHNADGAAALSRIMEKFSGKITAVIGVMRDKDYKTVLKYTLKHCKAAVAVGVESMPRSLDAEALKHAAEIYCPCVTASDYGDAVEKARQLSAGEPVFVFGSLYLASGIRKKLKKF